MMTKIKHLYIHIPFCQTICSYCDFCHVVYNEALVDQWLDKITAELTKLHETFETIYVGGGTPSCLNYSQLIKLLSLIDPLATAVKEYTIEVNPENIDLRKIEIIKQHSINRVSIGLQSSNPRLLKLMNRHHTYQDATRTIKDFRNIGIDNISIDVMYSLPSQSMEDLKETIADVLKLNVPHISLYSLTIEANTIFGKQKLKPLDEDMEADMYEYIEAELTKSGYLHYEIANFAKAGYESKHNLGYWNYDDYLGLGAGATGKYNHQRYVATNKLNEYLTKANPYTIELIDNKEAAFENIMMSLRTIYGLDLALFKERYSFDFKEEYKWAIEKNKQYLDFINNRCVCNKREILNTILLDFMD